MSEPAPLAVPAPETGRSMPQFFLGIGAQKAGTTWLGDYFASHPEVYFSPIKELHFFDAMHVPKCSGWNTRMETRLQKLQTKRSKRRRAQSMAKRQDEVYRGLLIRVAMPQNHLLYREYFLTRLNGEKAFGEISPSYALLPRSGYLEILELFPSARFIFSMRNPVDRYWSALRHKYRDSDGIDLHARFSEELDDKRLHSRTDYQTTLETLYGSCDPSHILVLFYEEMFGPNARTVVKGITDFLGISFVEPDSETKVNEGITSRPLSLDMRAEAARTFSDSYSYVAKMFKDKLPQQWLEDMALI